MPLATTALGLILAWSGASAVQPPAALSCAGHSDSASAPPQRIELYTSEGCSSCPPAERWLADLPAVPASVWLPLAFHVDYWDGLGWPDRFADRRYSARQQQVARRAKAVVYTPGVFVEGREWRGWRTGGPPAVPPAAGTTATPLGLRAELDLKAQRLHWRFAAAAFPGHPLWLALIQNGLRTQVQAGENAGAELQHGHVVRWLADAREHAHGEAALPADFDWRFAALVAWVEAEPGGATLAALRLPLRACEVH